MIGNNNEAGDDEKVAPDLEQEKVSTVTASGSGAADASKGVGGGDGETVVIVVDVDEDLAPPAYDDVLRFWASMFVSVAEDAATALENLDPVVEPAHRNTIAAAWNALGQTAMRTASIIGAWLDGVPADAPALVASSEDPGDLTCPRCDGPITLAALRAEGICDNCQRAEADEYGAGDQSADTQAVG